MEKREELKLVDVPTEPVRPNNLPISIKASGVVKAPRHKKN